MVRRQPPPTSLVPELDVDDLDVSLRFYVGLIGFTVVFERSRERFVYLGLDGAELMLQEAAGPGRRFRTAPLEHPFGRGINLQIAVRSLDEVHEAVVATGIEPIIEIEERWYDVDVVRPVGSMGKSGLDASGQPPVRGRRSRRLPAAVVHQPRIQAALNAVPRKRIGAR